MFKENPLKAPETSAQFFIHLYEDVMFGQFGVLGVGRVGGEVGVILLIRLLVFFYIHIYVISDALKILINYSGFYAYPRVQQNFFRF